MAEAPDLHSLAPDPLEPSPGSVERYVTALQETAGSDPELARRLAWDQIRLAGARAGSRPEEAHDSLNRMFRMGSPPDPPLSGPMDGILVCTTIWRPLDTLLRALTGSWMPWTGKRFDLERAMGDNLLTRSARLPARILWPSYRLEESGLGGFAAFRFRTYIAPGKVDPDVDALKIDYDSEENPGLLIRDILDELVEVVPGANLGKVLLRRRGGEDWALIGYFALQPVTAGEAAAPAERETAAATA